VTVAVLQKLLAAGQLDPDAETVILNTGDGLKTLDAVAPVAKPTATIRPSLEAFRAAGLT
jgi:threonine synthase